MSTDQPSDTGVTYTESLTKAVGEAIAEAGLETGSTCLDCQLSVHAGATWYDLDRQTRERIRNFAAHHATTQDHRVATLGLSLMDPGSAILFLEDSRPQLLHDATEGGDV